MGCKIPTVEKCCCCKLSTGGMVLGVYGAIGTVFNVLFTILLIIFYDDFVQKIKGKNADADKFLAENKSTIQIVLGCLIIVIVGLFVMYILLIQGIRKKKPSLVMPSLVVWGIVSILAILFALVQILNIPAFISAALAAAFYVYVWICLYSLYKTLEFTNVPQESI